MSEIVFKAHHMGHGVDNNARMTSEDHNGEYPLYLYEFRYRCERTGKWRKARYRAEVAVIRERHAEFEIVGEPMVIKGPAGTFSPSRRDI